MTTIKSPKASAPTVGDRRVYHIQERHAGICDVTLQPLRRSLMICIRMQPRDKSRAFFYKQQDVALWLLG